MNRSFVRGLMQPRYVVPVAAWVGCALLAQYTFSGMEGMTRVGGPSAGQALAAAAPETIDRVELSEAPAIARDRAAAVDAAEPTFAERARAGDRI